MSQYLVLTFRDLFDLIPADARWAAVNAAEMVLEKAGVTLEECVQAGANDYGENRVGEVVNFFDPHARVADAWQAALAAAHEVCGTKFEENPTWRLEIVNGSALKTH